MKLEEEWKELIQKNEFIYIYGAGKIGKRIWNLIQREHAEVKGFLVSDLAGNPVQLNDVPVYTPEQIEQKDSLILISVTDLYQEGILAHLKELGFINLVVAYKFSFMAVEAPQEMPETIMIDTRELFWCQYRENAFNRYDTIVRILAIENYYKKNDFGMDLYEKMQNLRHSTESYGKIAVDRFAKLIESFAGGYWESSELVVDEKLQLFDGSHRLALALYHALPQVKIRILGKTENILYGREWFNERFTDQEIALIEAKLKEMEKICWQAVKGILWPNVKEYFDEITVDISKQYNVFNIKDINMPYESFIQAVRGVYQIDSIADWKVETKIKHMQGEEPYIVRTFDIDMENPEFRVKTEGTTLSKKGELLKNLVRTKYKKVLSDYFPDIIFHTADNFKQSEYLDAMFCDAFSLEPLFDKIKDYKWIMIKEESNYIPNDFPKSFPLYKDIDLFCVKEDRECVEKCIQEFLETYTRGIYTWRRVSKNINNSFYRFEVQGFLLFGIDLWCADKYLKDNFIKRSIENRIEKNGYYVPQIRDEVIYRLAEFCQHPDKIRHLDFVKQNRKYLDKDYVIENAMSECVSTYIQICKET